MNIIQTQALQFTDYGNNDDATWQPITLPTPSADQVLVDVLATAPSAFDLGVQNGDYRSWLPLHFPAVLGTEAVGVVKQANFNKNFAPGDVVVGMVANPSMGAYAAATILDANSLQKFPDGVAADQGLVQLTAVPAYLALFNNGQLQPGQRVLIQGGAGGVGTMAVQLAHEAGAKVITTSRPDDFDQLKALGADETLDYHSDISAQIEGVDLVIDTAGGRVLADSFAVVRPGGRIISLVSRPSAGMQAAYPAVHAQFLKASDVAALPTIMALIAAHRIRVPIQKRFTLDKAGILAAIDYQRKQHVFGHIAIVAGG